MGRKFDGACAPCWFDRVFWRALPGIVEQARQSDSLIGPKPTLILGPGFFSGNGEDPTEPDEYHFERRVMTVQSAAPGTPATRKLKGVSTSTLAAGLTMHTFHHEQS